MAKLLLSKSDEEYLEKCATQLKFSYGIIVGQVSVWVGSVGGVLCISMCDASAAAGRHWLQDASQFQEIFYQLA